MEELRMLNPWWRDGSVKEDLAKPYRRRVFPEIVKGLEKRQIQVITGLRRVGKSTILYQLVDHIIKAGVSPLKVLYYSFDLFGVGLRDILREYSQLTGINWETERVYLLLDEIQKLGGWSSWIKLLYDTHPNLKLILSGSSSLHLEEEASANLAGRYMLHKIDPLSLVEFLELKAGGRVNVDNVDLWIDELRANLRDYLMRPFPEIVNWTDELRIREYIRESILEKVIKSDLAPYGLNPNRMMELLSLLYSYPGMYFNANSLSKELSMSKKTLYKYLDYMERTYLIKLLRNYRPSLRVSSRKMKKVYPYHWSLLQGLGTSPEEGLLLETVASSILDAPYYWRESAREVDFILIERGSLIPVEVKARRDLKGDDLKGLIHFMKRFGVSRGYVIFQGEDFTREYGGFEVCGISLLSLCAKGRSVIA